MNSTWTEFLLSRGAHLESGAVMHFGDPDAELVAARDGAVLTDLSHYGLISLAGEDARTFLHSLITNDLRGLKPELAVFAGLLSAKGRMLANFLVMQRDDEILVFLPASLVDAIQKRLSMYVLRAKVRIRDASDEWVRLGLNGPDAAAWVGQALGLELPAAIMAVAHGANGFVLCLGPGRYDLFVRPDGAPALWDELAGKASSVGRSAWDWLLIQAGVPTVLPPTQDHFVPQMANMEVLGGVSFNKGCYPGQEVVARSQYLGKVKRRLYLAHVDAPAQAGDELFAAEPQDQAAGVIANGAPAPGGGWDVLAVVLAPSVESGPVWLKTRGGAPLAFRPLPYGQAA